MVTSLWGAEGIGFCVAVSWNRRLPDGSLGKIGLHLVSGSVKSGALGIRPSIIGPLDLHNLGFRPGNDEKRVNSWLATSRVNCGSSPVTHTPSSC